MAEITMDASNVANAVYAASFGLTTNLNGGTYQNGNPYDKSKRLEVLRIIERRKKEGKSTTRVILKDRQWVEFFLQLGRVRGS